MPGNLDKYDFFFALVAMIISIYVVGMINQRECTLVVTEISKRCDLPIDVQNLRIKDDVLLDAKDLADMEYNWVSFKARFIIKDNKLSMEMVRLQSTKKITSDWRMDPQTATKGSQWFTLRGRWVGKPLSFEFDQRFSMVNDDAKPVKRGEPWFNFKARTWLGKKVLKQVDLSAVPERTMPASHDATESPPVYMGLSKYEHDRMENMKGTTISPEYRVKDDKTAEMTRQGATEMHSAKEAILPEDKYEMVRNTSTGTGFSHDRADLKGTEKVNDDLQKPTVTDNPAIVTTRVDVAKRDRVKGRSQPKCPRFREYDAYTVVKNTSVCLADQTSMDECPLNASEADHVNGYLQKPTLTDDKATLTKMVDVAKRRVKGRSQPKCPRFLEYNASNVVKNTSVCLVDEPYMDQCPLNASETIYDGASDGVNLDLQQTYEEESFGRGIEVVDNDCAWYSPTQVLLGAAAVTTVTVTVATSYVMMARPQYFWAQ